VSLPGHDHSLDAVLHDFIGACEELEPAKAPSMTEAEHGRRDDTAVLTARMKRGDESAYRRFYELHFARLLRYLLVVTRGREEAAQEAIQLTLLRVVRHIRVFETEQALWSWLTVLARSALIDEARKRNRYLALLDRFFRVQPPQPPDADVDARLLALLEASLAGLPEEDRDLIRQKYFARRCVHDIAAATGRTEKSVESRLVRIRRHLKTTVLSQLHDEPAIRR
jgi:RNA polymerase sigma-70 factor (ECF subfamily)